MQILKYFIFILLSVSAICILIFAIKSKKPLKMLIFNAIFGITAIIAVNLTSKFTGVHIFINAFSVFGSAVYGLPAVIGFIASQLIFL